MANKKLSALSPSTPMALTDFLVRVAASAGGDTIITVQNFLNSFTPSNAWTPTITGFGTAPTGGVYQYMQIGKFTVATITMPNSATSNATSFTVSLPTTAKTITNALWSGFGQGEDNGSTLSTPVLMQIASAGTVVNLYPTAVGGSWTSSGAKRLISGTIIYESA